MRNLRTHLHNMTGNQATFWMLTILTVFCVAAGEWPFQWIEGIL